tara:strand:+ start:1725 stop:2561 length:837 start_codon:yes stop_codon:yes gene_type:complete
LKILLIQENGHHDKNRKFRECFSLQRSFSKLGHSCDVWGNRHQNFHDTPDWESYDWIINLEQYDTGWVPSLSHVQSPKKIFWSIDAHVQGIESVEKIFEDGKYDYLLHSTKDFVKEKHHTWFPNAFDDSLIYPMEIEKTIDIGFCGNYVNRKPILEYLESAYGLHLDIFVIGDDMVKAINSYKCHFNLNIGNDINYRSFETIGCRTLLLTNYNHQYEELGFKHDVNCLMYKNQEELISLIDRVKNDDVTEISNRGYELSKRHTYDERVKFLLENFSDE